MSVRAALFAEQLLHEIPGGIGTYVRALVRRLPPAGVELEPVVAWHRRQTLSGAGLSHARRLHLPRQLLYRRWRHGSRPGVGGTAQLVHAPSMAFPAPDGRPLVVTVHDLNFLEHPDAYPEAGLDFHRMMLGRIGDASLIIAPSSATADALAALPNPPQRVRVVPMGTDMEPPDVEERDRLLDNLRIERPYVLWMGTLEPRKNPEGVIRGFVEALDAGFPQDDSMHLYMVGPRGWFSGDLAQLISTRGLSDRLRRIDAQPLPVRAALYSGAAAFVFPSLAEGFGLPIVEAMACGAPVVTSNRSSMPEVAGAAAELCDPDDPHSIGMAIAKILRDPDLAEDLRRVGYKRAREFTWDRTAQGTVSCYREALGDAADL
ncbi:MAG TPA: glycosyltransferase family 1 protein [Actinomycetota bacterium]|nr:glycosyltransferase family 1 protein [Actinomycetota bacterium]